MFSINYIKLGFTLLTIAMVILSGLMNKFETKLPAYIRQVFRYGKFAYSGKKPVIKPVEVPKAWFRHFYIFSSLLTSITFLALVIQSCFHFKLPEVLSDFLDLVGGKDRPQNVSGIHVLLSMALLSGQCCRRFYDTQYISVFGEKSRMNINHYFIGFIHYGGAVTAILAEANLSKLTVVLSDLSLIDWAASCLFIWACYHQFKITVILANLRKNKKGDVVTQEHKLPNGDWFEYLSSPHLIAEILMYFSLALILRENSTWFYVFVWVLTNQVETSLLNHWWYQETFKQKYPKKRSALIPLVY